MVRWAWCGCEWWFWRTYYACVGHIYFLIRRPTSPSGAWFHASTDRPTSLVDVSLKTSITAPELELVVMACLSNTLLPHPCMPSQKEADSNNMVALLKIHLFPFISTLSWGSSSPSVTLYTILSQRCSKAFVLSTGSRWWYRRPLQISFSI